jgi:hypothetical protein
MHGDRDQSGIKNYRSDYMNLGIFDENFIIFGQGKLLK